jgi:hypothetical protein
MSHVADKAQVVRMRFGDNPSGLTTVGITPIRRAEAARAFTISEIALVTKS